MFATDLEAVMNVYIFPFSIYLLLSDFVNLCSFVLSIVLLLLYISLTVVSIFMLFFLFLFDWLSVKKMGLRGESTLIIITVNCYELFAWFSSLRSFHPSNFSSYEHRNVSVVWGHIVGIILLKHILDPLF